MPIITWIVLGLIVGFIASRVVNKTGDGLLRDLGLGSIGAVAGGWLVNMLGMAGASGLNLWSVLLASAGAVFALIVYHALQDPSANRAASPTANLNQPRQREETKQTPWHH